MAKKCTEISVYFLATDRSVAESISNFTILSATGLSVAKKYIRLHYTFSHGGLWLKSILDLSTLFSHGRSVAKIYIKFHYTFSHERPWLKSILRFQYTF